MSRTTSLDAPTPVETSRGQLVGLRIISCTTSLAETECRRSRIHRLLAAKRFKDSSQQPVDFAADARASYVPTRQQPAGTRSLSPSLRRGARVPRQFRHLTNTCASSTRAAAFGGRQLRPRLESASVASSTIEGLLRSHQQPIILVRTDAEFVLVLATQTFTSRKPTHWRSSARICRTNHPPKPCHPWPRRRPHSKASCRCTLSVRRHQQ